MAPYTVTIKIQNSSDTTLEYLGSSNVHPLDGTTTIDMDLRRIDPGQTACVLIAKSGGTDGLFTLITYRFPFRSTSLSIFARMPASAGMAADVKLVDQTMGDEALKDNSRDGAASVWYYDRQDPQGMMEGPRSSDAVEMLSARWKYPPGRGDQEV